MTLPIWRMLPQVMALRADIPPPMTHLIGHAQRTLAIKPLPDGRVMVSGGWRGRWDAATGRGVPVAEQVEGNRLEAVAVYPALADLAVDEVYTDRVEMLSVDGIPIIDYSARRGEYAGGRGLVGAWLGDCAGGCAAAGGVGAGRGAAGVAGALWVWAVFVIHHRGTEGTEKTFQSFTSARS